MRELNSVSELECVSGGFGAIVRKIGDAWMGEAIVSATKAIINGPGPVSSNTKDWGVVGPGSRSATNPSSTGAINGSDSMSDRYAGGAGGFAGGGGGGSNTSKPLNEMDED